MDDAVKSMLRSDLKTLAEVEATVEECKDALKAAKEARDTAVMTLIGDVSEAVDGTRLPFGPAGPEPAIDHMDDIREAIRTGNARQVGEALAQIDNVGPLVDLHTEIIAAHGAAWRLSLIVKRQNEIVDGVSAAVAADEAEA